MLASAQSTNVAHKVPRDQVLSGRIEVRAAQLLPKLNGRHRRQGRLQGRGRVGRCAAQQGEGSAPRRTRGRACWMMQRPRSGASGGRLARARAAASWPPAGTGRCARPRAWERSACEWLDPRRATVCGPKATRQTARHDQPGVRRMELDRPWRAWVAAEALRHERAKDGRALAAGAQTAGTGFIAPSTPCPCSTRSRGWSGPHAWWRSTGLRAREARVIRDQGRGGSPGSPIGTKGKRDGGSQVMIATVLLAPPNLR